MNQRQPGLRKRMQLEARRISHQHEQIDAFFALVVEALNGGDAGAARRAFRSFQDALDAHFEVEERTHFPALHGMDPTTDAELSALVREHADFRQRLAQLDRLFTEAELDGVSKQLAGLADLLRRHEAAEERLFERTTAAKSG